MIFVLVHGGFHGGWCWQATADHLRRFDHVVFTPTCTGSGERRHLLSPTTGIASAICDVLAVLDWEELSNVVLVGHSLAGTTISGVADQRPFRLRQLIFLDSLLLQNGECLLDHTPEDIITQRRQSAARSSDNTVPPFPATAFGLTDLDHINRVNRLATPQAFGSFTERMALNNPIGNGIPCTYVRCTQPPHLSAAASSRWAQQQPDWQFVEMEACHDVMIEKPVELAELLVRLAGPG